MMKNKVLVIGELCTDVFKYGITNRKSPEGNGPVFIQTDIVSGNGMAGNTAMNLEAMGLDVDTYFDNGKITKTRYVNKDTNELYLRVDENDVTNRIDIYDLPDLVKYDAVVISDYCKGFLKEEDIDRMVAEAEQFKEQDDALRKVVDAKNSLENTLYSAKNGMDENLSDSIKEEIRQRVTDDITWLEAQTNSTTVSEYEERTKSFNEFLQSKSAPKTNEDDDDVHEIADVD